MIYQALVLRLPQFLPSCLSQHLHRPFWLTQKGRVFHISFHHSVNDVSLYRLCAGKQIACRYNGGRRIVLADQVYRRNVLYTYILNPGRAVLQKKPRLCGHRSLASSPTTSS